VRLSVSDWAIASSEDGDLRGFGRVNRIATASGSRKAFCSIFWLFDGDELARCGSSPDWPKGPQGKEGTPLKRMVASFSGSYRLGFHRLEVHR
jgi:hypothetical protein